ncbi:MAG: hypothetical protein R2932_30600 [Caldilineaceae bacterium]
MKKMRRDDPCHLVVRSSRHPLILSVTDKGNNMGAKGFFTDTTICIGCKACEVACKEWNQLPDDGFFFSGMSYDNTVDLGASTWRHVEFIERAGGALGSGDGAGQLFVATHV